MSRYFSIEHELERIDRGLNQTSDEWGTTVEWFVYNPDSPKDELFDVGSQRDWSEPILVPVLWALRTEGRDSKQPEGLHTRDSLQFAVAKNVIRDRLGWEQVLTREGMVAFLRDRIRYEGRMFTVTDMQVEGQLEGRDVVVGVVAREVRPDEEWIDEPPEDPVAAPGMAEYDDLFDL